ncbi:hypothetical protein TURU_123544 [Turdus rufiventris]|nr:hypothetical protein TURU_123544 [Turdus rufiventris]
MTSLPLLATSFLIQAGMPLAFLATRSHCWLMFSRLYQHPQVPFCLGTVQPHHPQPITLQGVTVAKMQDSALGLIKPHPIGFCPSIYPVQVSLQSSPTFQQINTCFLVFHTAKRMATGAPNSIPASNVSSDTAMTSAQKNSKDIQEKNTSYPPDTTNPEVAPAPSDPAVISEPSNW